MIGLDTETHKGKAVLVATPRRHIVFPRTFGEILDFLFQEEEYIAYNADYDVCAIMKFLGPPALERLYKLGKWSVEVEMPSGRMARANMKYIPRKMLKVTMGTNKNRRRFVIYDLVQFYNMSLDKAAKKFLNVEKKDPGVKWSELAKVLRKGGERAQKIIDYCRHDSFLVEELAKLTKEKFAKIGVDFERPISCASLSYQYFKSEMKFGLSPRVNETARESFRGGMIECLKTGYFKKAWYIDVRSAYPAAIGTLYTMPDNITRIKHGKLDENVSQACNAYASIDCTVSIPRSWYKSPIPYFGAGDAMLLYPTGRWRSFVDLTTFKKLTQLGFVEKIHGGVQAWSHDERQPFKEQVEYLYLQRALGEDLKWSVKIILNSLYGKFAETRKIHESVVEELLYTEKVRIGWRGVEYFTPHTNFFMAGEITSRTRWKLFEEIDHEKVIFYATDGVFLTEKPTTLNFGTSIGQWSEPEEVSNLVVVGSGVYCYKTEDGKIVNKFRGFDSTLKLYELLDRKRHSIPTNIQRNQKLGATIVNQRWERFNVIHIEERELNVNFDRKRVWEKDWTAKELLHRSFQSRPWQVFDKQIGV